MNTPPVYVFENTNTRFIQPLYTTPRDGDSMWNSNLPYPVFIFLLTLAALILLLLLIGLIVLIYNLCRYGACCPPAFVNDSCCCRCWSPCCWSPCCGCGPPPDGVQVIKPSPSIRSSSYATGSYVGRGTRLNQATYVCEPRTIRAGSLPIGTGRRNSVIIVGEGSAPRRRTIRAARPQIIVSEPTRLSTLGRRSILALPSSTSYNNQGSIRCYTPNEPLSIGGGGFNDDDGEIRVIVRNQPYTSRSTIIESPLFVDSGSYISTSGGCGQCGYGGGGVGISNGGFDYGQHSATIDVDQVPEYSSDVGIVQQGKIYPSLY